MLRRSGSTRERRPPIAARGDGAGAMEDLVGQRARHRAPGSRRGGCRQEGAEESLPFAVGRSLLPSAMMGAEQGTGNSLPAALERSHRRPPGGGRASSRPPTNVQCHRMAPRVTLSWLRTERQCVREPDQEFFFSSLPSLVSVAPHASVSCTLASSVHTPRYRSRRDRSPRGGGVGAVFWVPPGLRGAMGVCGEHD